MSNPMAGSNAGPQFEITYRETHLFAAPSQIGGTLGMLHKGARMAILSDPDPYYFYVQLPNGIEGYAYKDAGKVTGSLAGVEPQRIEPSAADASAPAYDVRTTRPAVRPAVAPPAPRPARPVESTGGVAAYDLSSGDFDAAPQSEGFGLSAGESIRRDMRAAPRPNSIAQRRSPDRFAASSDAGRNLVIVSAEIAVLDGPNIVGQQVAKLRKGDHATIIGGDSFFYEIEANGVRGFVPRYAGNVQ